MENERIYIAIDLKSFYASVECIERGLDPMTTNLVVADISRTEKTICLAVSPSLKAYGIPGRPRLFEVVSRIKQVNAERQRHAPCGRFVGKSVLDTELQTHPELAVDYIAATPRMAFYIEYSTRVHSVYLKYIAPEDIHVYSIDEVFIDATEYLKLYRLTPRQLAMRIIGDVLATTGITATAGIGTNMYLAKIAMDIVAKHIPADKDGVRIAELDEMSYRRLLWNHRPITDFWRVGRGTAKRLHCYGMDTMGQVARCSIDNEELLYELFGVNAELLIDHAWGWEPCPMEMVKAYKPTTNSISSGQVLSCAYTKEKARVVVREMVDAMSLELLDKRLVTNQLVLTVGYAAQDNISNDVSLKFTIDRYGRKVPKHAHGTANLDRHTSSNRLIADAVMPLFDRIVNSSLHVHRLNLTANNVIAEEKAAKPAPIQPDLFTDYEALARRHAEENAALAKERRMQETLLDIRKKFGKNIILKGLNFADGATAKDRNQQIGGHKA
ncbi:MAG: DNA methylase [Prevotella sp.]|nr:DNA methylase [Prevotella sp.]